MNRELRYEHGQLLLDEMKEGTDRVTKEKIVSIPTIFTMEGVMNGWFKPRSEIDNPFFWRFFEGLPFRDDHPPGDQFAIVSNTEIAGYTDRPFLRRIKGRSVIGGMTNIWTGRDRGKDAIRKIVELGKEEISIGYYTNPMRREGEYHDPTLDKNIPYKEIETDLFLDHLALVDLGACSPEMGCGLKLEILQDDEIDDDYLPPFFSGSGTGPTILRHGEDDDTMRILEKILGSEGAVSPHQTPKAPEDTSWTFSARDGDGIIERGGWKAYKQAHGWFEGTGTPEEKKSYKLPHHKVFTGSVKVIWRGVAAAAVVVQGGRGGLNIPPGDVPGVKRHLSRHYSQFDREPPWDAKGDLARSWLYAEEFEALMIAREGGILDDDWYDQFEVSPENVIVIRGDGDKAINRDISMLLTESGEGTSMTDDVCEKHLALEEEIETLKTDLEEATTALEEVKDALEKKTEEHDVLVADHQTLVDEKEEKEREDLLARLEEAMGLKKERILKILHDRKILKEEASLEDVELDNLAVIVASAELGTTKEKILASDQEYDPNKEEGIPGIDFDPVTGVRFPKKEA